MRSRSDDPDPVLGIPASPASASPHGPPVAQPAAENDARRGRAPRRRSRPWSVLDLVWSFGDYSSARWSARFRIEPFIVVAAHDGVVLNQFLLDLTKAILDGRGWEVLLRRTRFDGSCYVITDTYPRSEPRSDDPVASRPLPFPSGGARAPRPQFPAA